MTDPTLATVVGKAEDRRCVSITVEWSDDIPDHVASSLAIRRRVEARRREYAWLGVFVNTDKMLSVVAEETAEELRREYRYTGDATGGEVG